MAFEHGGDWGQGVSLGGRASASMFLGTACFQRFCLPKSAKNLSHILFCIEHTPLALQMAFHNTYLNWERMKQFW